MLLLSVSWGWSQSYVESALTFSQSRPGGSARIQAMGGSQIALGGDYSSALSNPAGLGMFNRSEVTLTPGLSTYSANAHYFGEDRDASRSTFVVPGLSLVLNIPINSNSGFESGSFAITMTRTNDFNRSVNYAGNANSSLLESFIQTANGYNTNQFDPDGGDLYNSPTGLAYYNYLIGPAHLLDQSFPDNEYFTDVKPNAQNYYTPRQQEDVQTRGITNQWSFSYGANYKDLLFFGASIGVSSLRYKNTKAYSEAFTGDEFVNGFDLQETLNIRGTGVNATLGAIVRPVNFLQVGISYTTPTFYQLTETYEASMSSSWKNFEYYSNKPNYGGQDNPTLNNESASTDVVTSDYSLTVPSKFSAGLAFISKYGLLTGDVELANYSRAKYSSNTIGVGFGDENQGIKETYKSVVNYRGGLELRFKIFRLRGGYGIQANPYRGDYDSSIKSVSGGVGVKLEKFHIDFAWVQSSGNNLYSPYYLNEGGPVVELENKTTTGIVTFGFNF
ncbi:OmpP1/FadL family transporter [Chryseolinea lacunae]|uniref:Long-chain fatty acid transporter n=1 Tax=Chryseolinea lacunae TaxID=2801331 RepID=A0ABS1KSU6_9BACT|nr:hypothetical protein [Chryseolinea lacunae]MBL0742337.1 hypothetical protein [Chryseolinea lacunae]